MTLPKSLLFKGTVQKGYYCMCVVISRSPAYFEVELHVHYNIMFSLT